MNKSEITKILYRLSAAYPAFRATDPETMTDLWTGKLYRFADEVVKEAADLIIDESKYFPSLHEMIVKCHQLVNMRIQYWQNEHARLRYKKPFIEKDWLELIAGYKRCGAVYDAGIAEEDMDRARDDVISNATPEWVIKQLRELEKKWEAK